MVNFLTPSRCLFHINSLPFAVKATLPLDLRSTNFNPDSAIDCSVGFFVFYLFIFCAPPSFLSRFMGSHRTTMN